MSVSYLRAELHNHSTQSDGSLTVPALVEYAAQKRFGVLAITDHNTPAGQAAAFRAAEGTGLSILPGIECTTMYGHVLALGLQQMCDWTGLDPNFPEPFFNRLRAAGALAVGIAHPFCLGEPVMVGCRFAMRLRCPEQVDYIEVFNTGAGDAFSGNESALDWWEELVLQGNHVAACSGMDLHRVPQTQDVFTTFVPDVEGLLPEQAVLAGILGQRTVLSKGPVLRWTKQDNVLTVSCCNDSGYQGWNAAAAAATNALLVVREDTGRVRQLPMDLQGSVTVALDEKTRAATVKLYREKMDFSQLLCVGPAYHKPKEKT